ncbi:MAG TPA: hypothetical protein VOA87_13195 [Thermoanaerobaculia bacterium]|nr:hypothetical protein [Thermoanaerobaculia bacterium]
MSPARRTVLLLTLLLMACQGRPSPAAEPTSLHDLHGLAELKAAFNTDAGKPRLMLLLSPT